MSLQLTTSLLASVLLLLVVTVAGQNGCPGLSQTFNVNCTTNTKPDKFKVVFVDVFPEERRVSCSCDTEMATQDESFEGNILRLIRGEDCYTTRCEKQASALCPLKRNFRNRQEQSVNYIELARENCTMDDGSLGEAAVCCGSNSEDILLFTAFGGEVDEFPHQVGVSTVDSKGETGVCGGTIYTERWVLTAAHCIVDEHTNQVTEKGNITVAIGSQLGGHEGLQGNKNHQYKVANVVCHEGYSGLKKDDADEDWEEPANIYNDIALLQLDRDINFGPKVKALRIAPKGFHPLDFASNAVIIGWGNSDSLDVTQHLQKANFVIREDRSCFGAGGPYVSAGNSRNNQYLCVGGILGGKHSSVAGQGDSGGPAICRGADDHGLLCGVTSWGAPDDHERLCRRDQNEMSCTPSVYAEVEHFGDWIEGKAGNQSGLKKEDFHNKNLYGAVVRGESQQYQHQVHITSKTGRPCGGTLISNEVVVTAASCVLKNGSLEQHEHILVTPSIYDLESQKGETGLRIREVVPLDGFAPSRLNLISSKKNFSEYVRIVSADRVYANDLALLILEEPASIDEDQLAKLPDSSPPPNSRAVEVAFPRDPTYGLQLRAREFRILDRADCKKRLKRLRFKTLRKFELQNNVFCGVETYSGGSQCDRELGGGLICDDGDGNDVLCGVQMFRLCETTIPNAFIDVSKVAKWIKSYMN